MKKDEFIIPKVTLPQLAIIGARSIGQNAAIMMAEARRNAPGSNQYKGVIDQATSRDLPLSGKSSAFGTAIFVDVTFDSVTYMDPITNNDITTPKISFQSILVGVSFPRYIVKTEIQGRNGTVKEYIGEGDAQVTFRGVIVGSNGRYPWDEVEALKHIIKAPVAIPVISQYLQLWDIDTIVFDDRSFEQDEGGYSYQGFSINAMSDTPQELKIMGI